jgi:hypothetical protein
MMRDLSEKLCDWLNTTQYIPAMNTESSYVLSYQLNSIAEFIDIGK